MRTILILALVPLCIVVILCAVLFTTPDCQYQIGQSFMTGSLLPKDTNTGLSFLKRAADAGQIEAQEYLGRSFLVGAPTQDLPLAIKYLTMGEKNKNSTCMYLLAFAYENGNGVPLDYKKSIDLY